MKTKSQKIQFVEFTIGQHSALVNNDWSGLSDEDIKALKSFVPRRVGHWDIGTLCPEHAAYECPDSCEHRDSNIAYDSFFDRCDVTGLHSDCVDARFVPANQPAFKPSAAFKKYSALLTGNKPLTKTEIGSLASILAASKKTSLKDHERHELFAMLNAKRSRPIFPDHEQQGIDWLRKTAFRTDGVTPRQTKDFPFGLIEIEVIKDFSHFTWEGFEDLSAGHYSHFVPVWRVHSKHNTASFVYYVCGQWGSVVVR
jgi:hypothetical protein